MTGFTDHGIDHGSISNINKWIEAAGYAALLQEIA